MKKNITILSIALFITLLGGCKEYNSLLKSNDYEAKLEAAVKYYNEKSYSRANQLLEDLTLHYHGKDLGEDISWYYANNLMKMGEYYMAEYQFRLFTRRFAYSPRMEEATYFMAYCCYQESPEYFLDQSITKTAVSELELFAERYPNSVHMPEINQYLDDLRNRLMTKDFEIAMGYFKTESYHAANVSLKNFINLYPDSPFKEEAMFYTIRSGYEYALNSQESKIRERMQVVINDFDKYAAFLKDSKYFSSAQNIYTKARAALAQGETSK